MMPPEQDFQRERERKIAEIRETGKTRQWPDTVPHRTWDTEHKAAAGWVLLTLACLAWAFWWLVS
jgi:hypothetical protein